MANHEFRKSIFRIFSDLIKSDNSISIRELKNIDNIIKSYGIKPSDENDGFALTLAEAADCISKMTKTIKDKLVRLLKECALADGECCRDEAILISAIEITCNKQGKIISLPLDNLPIISTQLLYIDSTYNPKKNELDKRYDEIKAIVELGGFELVYIPQIAETFRQKSTSDIKRLLRLINPTLNNQVLENRTRSLQEMDYRYFYTQVLNGKLQMGLHLTEPAWLIRIPDSTINGVGYANYLCYYIKKDNLYGQVKEYIDYLNELLSPYTVLANKHSHTNSEFYYKGFHKALIDVMATDRISPWEVQIYIRAGEGAVIDKSATGQKFSVMIKKGSATYPIRINGREAAFYLLLLCASAMPDEGINFSCGESEYKTIQALYNRTYRAFSYRDGEVPDLNNSSIFRTIKSNIMKELDKCGIEGSLHLFKPTKKGQSTYYIPIPAESVSIVTSNGITPLKESKIFKSLVKRCLLKI